MDSEQTTLRSPYRLSVETSHLLNGLWLALFIALGSLYIAQSPFLHKLGISPLLLSLLVGLLYGNVLRPTMPTEWAGGLRIASRQLLRLAIVLYGFRVTLGDMAGLGGAALALDVLVVATTIPLGYWVGTRLLGLDAETSLMCSFGAGVCGAAAILASDNLVKGGAARAAVAVATIVSIGFVALIGYPLLFGRFESALSLHQWGVLIGVTTHEVAQVAATSAMIGNESVTSAALLTKMGRVLLLAPALLIARYFWLKRNESLAPETPVDVPFPWFAVGFLCTAAVNSIVGLPSAFTTFAQDAALFLLTASMAAVGIDTTWLRLRSIGPRPFFLGAILFTWLVLFGFLFVSFFHQQI